MKQALFFSGGKDSFWCLSMLDGPVELVTTVDERTARVPIQGIRRSIVEAQAQSLGCRLRIVELPESCDNRTYVERVGDAIREEGYERLVFGDLFLEDIRNFRERSFSGLGVELRFPIWKRPTAELAGEMIDGGLAATVCCVNPAALPDKVLGQAFGRELLARLPRTVDPCGENGEFHTLVTAGPMMDPIPVEPGPIMDHLGHRVLDYRLRGTP